MQQHFFVGDHFSDYFRVPNFCIENVAPDNLVRGPVGNQILEAIVILHPGPKLLPSANAPMIPCKFSQRKDLNFQGLLYFLYVRTPSWHGLTSKIDFYSPTDLNKFGLDLVVLQGSFTGRQKLNDGLDVRIKIVRTEKNRKFTDAFIICLVKFKIYKLYIVTITIFITYITVIYNNSFYLF